jgi:putative phosphoribosyl transferase
MKTELYRDRLEAGRILGELLRERFALTGAMVLALPRGGVPVGLEIALALDATLDVFIVRKLGVPGHEELAMGAVAVGGFEVLDEFLVERLGITPLQIAAVADREMVELQRREDRYRDGRPPLEFHGRTVILVDDGLATGATMRAAIGAIRQQSVAELVVVVPVGSVEACEGIAREVDTLICPWRPEPFDAVGRWYQNFSQVSDEEVCECLEASLHHHHHDSGRSTPGDQVGSGF